jgi:hypothetical protein
MECPWFHQYGLKYLAVATCPTGNWVCSKNLPNKAISKKSTNNILDFVLVTEFSSSFGYGFNCQRARGCPAEHLAASAGRLGEREVSMPDMRVARGLPQIGGIDCA